MMRLAALSSTTTAAASRLGTNFPQQSGPEENTRESFEEKDLVLTAQEICDGHFEVFMEDEVHLLRIYGDSTCLIADNECRMYRPRERFNLAVDASMWIAPCLGSCRDVASFQSVFEKELRKKILPFSTLFLRACEIVVVSDRAAPCMKRETLDGRRRDRTIFSSSCVGTYDSSSGIPDIKEILEKNSSFREKRKNFRDKTPSGTSRGTSSFINDSADSDAPSLSLSSKHFRNDSFGEFQPCPLSMSHVRRFIRPVVNRVLRDLGVNSTRIFHRYDNNGEGENKCMNFSFAEKDLPRVILTNDSDAILLQLATVDEESRFVVYILKEPQTHGKSPKRPRRQARSISFEGMRETLIFNCDWTRNFDANARWLIVVWLIMSFGNDYVDPLIYSAGVPVAHDGTFTLKREKLYEAMRNMRDRDFSHFPLTKNNFLIAVAAWLVCLGDKSESMRYCFSPQRNADDVKHRQCLVWRCRALQHDERKRALLWLRRLYWSLLYARETPSDYKWEDVFSTDNETRINSHVQKCRVEAETLARVLPEVRDKFLYRDVDTTV